MAFNTWDPVAISSHGLLTTVPTPSSLNICEVVVNVIGSTSVQLKITKVGSGVTKMKIGYRIRKENNADMLSFTSVKNNPAIDELFDITGLTPNTLYEFFSYSTNDAGEYNDPGPVRLALPSSGGWRETTCNIIRTRYRTLVGDIVSGLETQYDNEDNEAIADNTRWVRLAIKLGASAQVSLGADKRIRAVGLLIASIFVPFSGGDQPAWELADIIEASFTSVTDTGVRFRTPTSESQGRISDSWQINVTCPFQVDKII